MLSKSFKSSGVRRLGPHHPPHAACVDVGDPVPAAQPQQHNQQIPTAKPPPAAAAAVVPAWGSKAQALSAFRSLVAGSAHARPSTAAADTVQAPDHPETGATACQQHDDAPRRPATTAAAAADKPASHARSAHHSTAPAAAHKSASTQPLPSGLVSTAQRQAHATPSQLVPQALSSLNKLQQQLSSRTLTYLYQFDGLLTSTTSTLEALTGDLSSMQSNAAVSGAQQAPLLQLLQDQAAAGDSAPTLGDVLDLLLQLCMQTWEVEVLLLQHHHAAEPQNTAQQAGQFHIHAQKLWEVWESHSLSSPDHPSAAAAAAAAGLDDTAGPAAAVNAGDGAWPLTEALCAALAVMAEAAAAWTAVQETNRADWCYLQLRKHLCSITAAGANDTLCLDTRRALQQLQFSILTGNLDLAARQGHQAMWANLTSMVQQLLQDNVMEDEKLLAASLAMSGMLAGTATSMLQANPNVRSSHSSTAVSACPHPVPPPAQPGSSSTAHLPVHCSSAASAVKLLEFTVELLAHARQQAAALEPCEAQQQQQQEYKQQAAVPQSGPNSLSQQVTDIQQQVFLQLAPAHLMCGQPGRVLECVSQLQGACTGRTPPPGLLQLSSLALLQQGKLGAASAQLCAWLQQGGQRTDEAVAAVRAFLVALHASESLSAAPAGGGATCVAALARAGESAGGVRCSADVRAAAVQQVAAAAAEHCRSEPEVALELVMQLLAEQGGSSSSQLSLEKLAVQLLAVEEVAQLLHKHQEQCKQCHSLLHDKGAAHYAAHRYGPAIELLTPAVFFATSLTAGKSARLLAMALLKSGQAGRALEYVGLAEQQEGRATACGCVIKLQAALQLQASASKAAGAATVGAAGTAGGSYVGAQAAGAAGHQDAAADQLAVLDAAKSLASVHDLSAEAMQAAFALCMQHNNTAAAWQVLLSWRDGTSPGAETAATAAAEGPAGIHPTAPQQQRQLQVLSIMHYLNAQSHALPDMHSRFPSAAAAAGRAAADSCGHTFAAKVDPQLQQQWLQDMCDTFCSCLSLVATKDDGRKPSSPASRRTAGLRDERTGAAVDQFAGSSSSSSSSTFTRPQVMWLVDVGLKLAVAAAEHKLRTEACAVLQCVLGACDELQQQRQQVAGAASTFGLDGIAALSSRCIAALCIVASLLLQDKPKPEPTTAANHLQQAADMLAAAQQHLQQHAAQWLHNHQAQQPAAERPADKSPAQPASTEAAAGAAVALPDTAWADAGAVAAAMLPLQLLVIRLCFAVSAHKGQEQHVKQLLQLLVKHPLTGPAELRAAAQECLQPGRPSKGQAVAALAYSHMLRLAAAAAPPDLVAVAEAAAGMLALVTSHAVKLKAVCKVVEVLAAARPSDAAAASKHQQDLTAAAGAAHGRYPPKSLQWLLATCWNAAVETCSSGDIATAQQYLQLVNALAQQQQQQQQQQKDDVQTGRQDQRAGIGLSSQQQQQQQQHQGQQHWLLGSRQYQQLCARLHQQHSQSAGGTPSALQGVDAVSGGCTTAVEHEAASPAAAAATAPVPVVVDCVSEQDTLCHGTQQQQQQVKVNHIQSQQAPAAVATEGHSLQVQPHKLVSLVQQSVGEPVGAAAREEHCLSQGDTAAPGLSQRHSDQHISQSTDLAQQQQEEEQQEEEDCCLGCSLKSPEQQLMEHSQQRQLQDGVQDASVVDDCPAQPTPGADSLQQQQSQSTDGLQTCAKLLTHEGPMAFKQQPLESRMQQHVQAAIRTPAVLAAPEQQSSQQGVERSQQQQQQSSQQGVERSQQQQQQCSQQGVERSQQQQRQQSSLQGGESSQQQQRQQSRLQGGESSQQQQQPSHPMQGGPPPGSPCGEGTAAALIHDVSANSGSHDELPWSLSSQQQQQLVQGRLQQQEQQQQQQQVVQGPSQQQECAMQQVSADEIMAEVVPGTPTDSTGGALLAQPAAACTAAVATPAAAAAASSAGSPGHQWAGGCLAPRAAPTPAPSGATGLLAGGHVTPAGTLAAGQSPVAICDTEGHAAEGHAADNSSLPGVPAQTAAVVQQQVASQEPQHTQQRSAGVVSEHVHDNSASQQQQQQQQQQQAQPWHTDTNPADVCWTQAAGNASRDCKTSSSTGAEGAAAPVSATPAVAAAPADGEAASLQRGQQQEHSFQLMARPKQLLNSQPPCAEDQQPLQKQQQQQGMACQGHHHQQQQDEQMQDEEEGTLPAFHTGLGDDHAPLPPPPMPASQQQLQQELGSAAGPPSQQCSPQGTTGLLLLAAPPCTQLPSSLQSHPDAWATQIEPCMLPSPGNAAAGAAAAETEVVAGTPAAAAVGSVGAVTGERGEACCSMTTAGAAGLHADGASAAAAVQHEAEADDFSSQQQTVDLASEGGGEPTVRHNKGQHSSTWQLEAPAEQQLTQWSGGPGSSEPRLQLDLSDDE